jgi:hypothetical protein
MLAAATACGRLRFDPVGSVSDDTSPSDDAGSLGDASAAPPLDIAARSCDIARACELLVLAASFWPLLVVVFVE